MRAAAKVVYLCLCHYFNGRYSSIVARKVNSNKKPFAGKVNKLVNTRSPMFCGHGNQTRLRSQSISRDAESLNSHF